jgi:RNA-directed DNA polymerase
VLRQDKPHQHNGTTHRPKRHQDRNIPLSKIRSQSRISRTRNPARGVVSPLLANIALNGIEEIHQSLRYADDMIIIMKPKDDAKAILDKVSEFRAERGMKVSEKKTKLTATTDGFDFLGWHFKVQNSGKFRCVPSADNFKAFRHSVKPIVNNSNYGATVKAQKLVPVVRGWRVRFV